MIASQEMLARGAEALGLSLDGGMLERFSRYQQLLTQWGARISLTSVRDPLEVVTHHFLDSLAVVAQLPGTPGTLVDVGAGAGFPGAVCALMRPDLAVTLVERTQKKAAFLLTLRRELGLTPAIADVQQARKATLRVLAQDVSQLSDRFDVVVSRAAFPPPLWQKVGAGLVAPGGLLLAMVSGREGALPVPPEFVDEIDHLYDVGAGPRRIRGWRRIS